MQLDVFFRSCSRVNAIHGNRRIVNCGKTELILRSLNSLIRSMNLAGGPKSTAMTLTVIDDHSDPQCLEGIDDLLSRANFPHEIIHLADTGNGASLLKHYQLARERARDLIYFVEDDYIHAPECIGELLAAHQQFSFFLKTNVVLHPCDDPHDYAGVTQSVVLPTSLRHWRSISHTTATVFLSKKTLVEHWDRFMALTHYSPHNGVTEQNTINLIYQTTPCFAPLPSLAAHVVDSKTIPPVVNWIKWWNDADPTRRRGEFPPPRMQYQESFDDERGRILPLVDEAMKSAVLIESKAGSVRANHYHKTDWHYCYVVKGRVEYHYRPAGSRERPLSCTLEAGETFYTPPLVEHAMVFPADTTLLCLGGNPRDQLSYEADVVRVQVYPFHG